MTNFQIAYSQYFQGKVKSGLIFSNNLTMPGFTSNVCIDGLRILNNVDNFLLTGSVFLPSFLDNSANPTIVTMNSNNGMSVGLKKINGNLSGGCLFYGNGRYAACGVQDNQLVIYTNVGGTWTKSFSSAIFNIPDVVDLNINWRIDSGGIRLMAWIDACSNFTDAFVNQSFAYVDTNILWGLGGNIALCFGPGKVNSVDNSAITYIKIFNSGTGSEAFLGNRTTDLINSVYESINMQSVLIPPSTYTRKGRTGKRYYIPFDICRYWEYKLIIDDLELNTFKPVGLFVDNRTGISDITLIIENSDFYYIAPGDVLTIDIQEYVSNNDNTYSIKLFSGIGSRCYLDIFESKPVVKYEAFR